MYINNIKKVAKKHLEKILHKHGGILYSSYETLSGGDIYLLGLNPTGNIELSLGDETIEQFIEKLGTNTSNAYLDENWIDETEDTEKIGKAALQKSIQYLLATFTGLDAETATRKTCASNLIFRKSKDVNELAGIGGWWNLAEQCWFVHQEIIKVVQPRLIISIGNSGISAYEYIKQRYKGQEVLTPSGQGNCSLKHFEINIDGWKTVVVGVPHLSRFASVLTKNEFDEWAQKIRELSGLNK